jgi:hypothetical protein
VEFGLFIQGYVPAFRRERDPDAEHHAFLNEVAAVEAADRAGFKYVWLTEHHFLDEYSHLSANDVMAGYLAHATERIHIGSGIFNPLPQVHHPATVAEKVRCSTTCREAAESAPGGAAATRSRVPAGWTTSPAREIWRT